MLLLCRFASRSLAWIEMSLCDLVHKGEGHLNPPPPAHPKMKNADTGSSPIGPWRTNLGQRCLFLITNNRMIEFLSPAFDRAIGASHISRSQSFKESRVKWNFKLYSVAVWSVPRRQHLEGQLILFHCETRLAWSQERSHRLHRSAEDVTDPPVWDKA